ncbi:MAG: GPW/gp25 family protein [Hormoscilla sp. GUM202]|nr:GPW/gp25 family protein [Hormoscilla sp. GUM202]
MKIDFLGVGWNFPVKLDGETKIAMAAYEESVRQAIWTVLSIAPGERPMRPQFGCGIHNLVFARNSADTSGQLVDAVRQALNRWEPRIDILEVDAYPQEGQQNKILIEINYQVRRTNNRYNLVYPFYLEY